MQISRQLKALTQISLTIFSAFCSLCTYILLFFCTLLAVKQCKQFVLNVMKIGLDFNKNGMQKFSVAS